METDFTFETIGVIMFIALIVAAFGSILTISAVIYAKRNKNYSFSDESEWKNSTIFVLNVACADIVYCILYFCHMIYAAALYMRYDLGDSKPACKFFVLGTQTVACISGWSIALTAVSAAFPKISPVTKKLWEKLSLNGTVFAIAIVSWILPTIFNLPKIFEQNVVFKPGKDHRSENEVGYICYPVENSIRVMWTDLQFRMNVTGDVLVLLLIALSATISWISFKKEISDNRDKLENDQLRLLRYNLIAKLKQKELSLSSSIICITYIICRFPLAISGHSADINQYTLGLHLCFLLYNLQFTTHFIIYAIFQNNFLDAYCDILRKIFPCYSNACCSRNSEHETSAS